jgi:hypothetical protein
MTQKITKIIWLALSISFACQSMNLLLRPYDTLIRPEVHLDRCAELAIWAEAGIRPAKGFDGDGAPVNVLRIWDSTQDALAMLDGFPDTSPITQLRNALDAADDGIRGHLLFDGKLHLDFGGAFGARWYFLPHAWITTYLPYYRVRLTDVTFQDLTQSKTAADLRVKELLINNLATVVNNFGDGLSLNGWKRTGLGDLNLMVEWLFNFPQKRPLLTNVEIDGRVGFTLPTGLKANPDLLFAFPFGYDGAVGILYGGGLTVSLGCQFKAGFDVQLLHLFGNTRPRRIKTAVDQSELLLLAKTPVYIDYGLTQRFNLFVQAYHVVGGLSLLAGYQFLKRGEDSLALNTCQFSTAIAQTAVTLEDWILHSAEFNLHYDFDVHMCPDSWIAPQASLFARVPFNGKRAVAFTTVGVMLAADF